MGGLWLKTRKKEDKENKIKIVSNYIHPSYKISVREKKVRNENRCENIHRYLSHLLNSFAKEIKEFFIISTLRSDFITIRSSYWIFCKVMSLDSADVMKLAGICRRWSWRKGERGRCRVMEVSREFVNGGKEEEKWRGEDKKARQQQESELGRSYDKLSERPSVAMGWTWVDSASTCRVYFLCGSHPGRDNMLLQAYSKNAFSTIPNVDFFLFESIGIYIYLDL